VHHFIGKDIINFHALFWPAVLEGAGFRKPTRIHTHGFVGIEGKKLSKSRGISIDAATYLEFLEPEYLRYYYATKLNGGIDDVDVNLDDFIQRVNTDLVGKIVNIASRCAGFINKQFDGMLASRIDDQPLWQKFVDAQTQLAQWYESGDTSKAVREISALADSANQYIAHHEPWNLVKQADQLPRVQLVCSQGINLFRSLIVYLKPILPKMAEGAEAFLGVEPLVWGDVEDPLLTHRINPYSPLFTRIQRKTIDKLLEASTGPEQEETSAATDKTGDFISIDEFGKLELKIARITSAEPVDGADKLLQLTLDLGNQERRVFAGIKQAYDPEKLVGRLTVVVANLAPREMRFGVSEGMVLAAGPGGKDIFLLSPDEGAVPGMTVR
jgi:methionyl-tRNA synthetase